MHELMEFLLEEINGAEGAVYIIRRECVKGDWYLSGVNIPVEDDLPLEATWTSVMADAAPFFSAKLVQDFAIAHLVPRPCTILKLEL